MTIVAAAFEFDRKHQVQITAGDIHLFAGCASHQLAINLRAAATWLADQPPAASTPALITGSVHVDRPQPRWLAGLQPQVLAVRGYPAAERLVFDLSNDQLIALERLRGESGIDLRLDLQGTLLSPPPDVHPVRDIQLSVPIGRSRWLELLEQAGTEVGIVLRVPSPLTDRSLGRSGVEDTPSMSRAVARLREARAALQDGAWEQCVGTCRKVLENLARLVTMPSASEVNRVMPARERTQTQRWAATYYDVLNLTHGAHHDGGGATGFSWNRADAEAVLATTAGLLVRYMASSDTSSPPGTPVAPTAASAVGTSEAADPDMSTDDVAESP